MAALGLRCFSLVAASESCSRWGARVSPCGGLSCLEHRLQNSDLVGVVNELSCSAACEILLGHQSNPCPLYRQADSYPLLHQESPAHVFIQSTRRCHSARCVVWGTYNCIFSVPPLFVLLLPWIIVALCYRHSLQYCCFFFRPVIF